SFLLANRQPCSQEFPVRTQGHTPYHRFVLQGFEKCAAFDVPDVCAPSMLPQCPAGPSQTLPIRGENHGADFLAKRCFFLHDNFFVDLPELGFPEIRFPVVGRRGELLPVSRNRDRYHIWYFQGGQFFASARSQNLIWPLSAPGGSALLAEISTLLFGRNARP